MGIEERPSRFQIGNTCMSQMDRATKALNAARSDHLESQFYCDGSKRCARTTAKRESSRARRRAARMETSDQTKAV